MSTLSPGRLVPATQAPAMPGGVLSRRMFLGAPLALAAPASGWLATLVQRVQALGGPGLLQSYDVAGTGDFDRIQAGCAYVYDNAVAGLALLAAGRREEAQALADALAQAQARDRFWHDGRLRNAYRAGPAPRSGAYPLPGWWDAAGGHWVEDGYQAGSATGVVAWAMLLWTALGGAYRAAAARAADWVERSVRGPRGFQGGFIGFEPQPQRLIWVSTEHNIDLVAGFTALGRQEAAGHASAFVAAMFLPGEGRFASGLRPDGAVNDHSAVDANLWPLLVQGSRPEWRAALHWIVSRHGLPANGPVAAMDGVDFNNDRDGIWLEGTAITALVAGRLGQRGVAARMMATLRAQTSQRGLIYASTTPTLTTGLNTGLDTASPEFLYYRRPHLAPTAWAVLAQQGANPFQPA